MTRLAKLQKRLAGVERQLVRAMARGEEAGDLEAMRGLLLSLVSEEWDRTPLALRTR